jgi:hypothetical protein
MCEEQESIAHLFLTCYVARQIWFWMSLSQKYFSHWHSIKDVVDFALSLPFLRRQSFMIALCAMCWTLWKHRNIIVFKSSSHTSIRNILCLIMTLVNYWAGRFSIALVRRMKQWMPENFDMIPLQEVPPALALPMGHASS